MQKNVVGQFVCMSLTAIADGSAVTTGTTTVYIVSDNGTQSTGAGTVTHKGNGSWAYSPTQAETNYNAIAFTFVNSLAVSQTVNVATTPAGFSGFVSPDNADIVTALADLVTLLGHTDPTAALTAIKAVTDQLSIADGKVGAQVKGFDPGVIDNAAFDPEFKIVVSN